MARKKKRCRNWANYAPRVLHGKWCYVSYKPSGCHQRKLGLCMASWGEQIPEGAPARVELGNRNWREGHRKYAWKYLLFPSEKWVDTHRSLPKSPYMRSWRDPACGCQGLQTHDKILPPDSYPCLVFLFIFLSFSRSNPKSGSSSTRIKNGVEGPEWTVK